MLRVVYEGSAWPIGTYNLSAATIASQTVALQNSSNLGLQSPYGAGTYNPSTSAYDLEAAFQAGDWLQLEADASGNPVLSLATAPTGIDIFGITPDSFVDCLRTLKCTVYKGIGIFKTDQYESDTYVVGDQLTVSTLGKARKATTGELVVAEVVTPPTVQLDLGTGNLVSLMELVTRASYITAA